MSNTTMLLLFTGELGLLLLPAILNWDKSKRGFVLAARSLWLHKLRAMLSVLGIIIGTAAVISLMAFGEGSMQDALDDIRRQGATNIIVRSVKPPDEGTSNRRVFVVNYGLSYVDYERFRTIPDISRRVPLRVFPTEARFLARMAHARLVATTPEYTDVHKIELSFGRFLTDRDNERLENVCVVAAGVADELFPFEDPMGKSVQLGSNFYRVVGVVRDRMPTGGSGGSQAAEDFNRDVYIPLATCRARFGEKIIIRQSGARSGEQVELHQITLTVDTAIDKPEGREKVKAVGDLIRHMLERHHFKRDWAVTVPLDRLEEAERAQARFTSLLVVIASISLLVGGIGIMNIMLATVTERTREIGIRRALGAKRRDITLQFLVEAVVQTGIGGILGVIVGVAIVVAVPNLPAAAAWLVGSLGYSQWALELAGAKLPAILQTGPIFLSLGVSIGVGVLFGWYPAQRAALLDPIEALRHE